MNINERINALTRKEREILSCLVDVKEKRGQISRVATEKYKVSRQTIYNWIAQSGNDILEWRREKNWKTGNSYNWKEIGNLLNLIIKNYEESRNL